MSDEIYEYFTEQREARKKKRKSNREYSLGFLKRKNIPFVELNNGVHVRLVLMMRLSTSILQPDSTFLKMAPEAVEFSTFGS